MTMPNIERFDQITAKAFARLYEKFPVPITLTTEFFGAKIDSNAWDESGAIADAEFVFSCLQWLAAAGYIDHKGERSPYYVERAVLTAKGLEILKAIPDSISSEKSIGERLIDGVKEGSTESLKEGVRYALAKGATLALGAIGIAP